MLIKMELQEILDNHTPQDEGNTIDLMIVVLQKGDASDVKLAKYFIEDTTEEGGDYLIDYQCLEVIISTYDLEWK